MRRFVAPLVVAVTIVATGCGGGGDDPVQIVRAAATRTVEAESSRIAMTMTTSAGGPEGTVTADGVFSYDPARGRMTMEMPFGSAETIFDGTVFYMRFPPAVASQLPGGKPWLRFDLAALGREAGVDVTQLTDASRGDPTQALRYLRGATDDVAEVGDERVRGVDTTHYRGTVDLRRAAAEYEGARREAIESAIDVLGTSEMPVDVWVDGEGRARKLAYTAGETSHVTMELFDFGVDVDVEPPPADEVVDLGAALAGADPG